MVVNDKEDLFAAGMDQFLEGDEEELKHEQLEPKQKKEDIKFALVVILKKKNSKGTEYAFECEYIRTFDELCKKYQPNMHIMSVENSEKRSKLEFLMHKHKKDLNESPKINSSVMKRYTGRSALPDTMTPS